MEKALIVKGSYSTKKIADDPTDDMFLSCAMEAKPDYIISRDPHLRKLKHFHGIKIIDIKAFVERVRKGK
jgi:predicted nucleic acid-binding protein